MAPPKFQWPAAVAITTTVDGAPELIPVSVDRDYPQEDEYLALQKELDELFVQLQKEIDDAEKESGLKNLAGALLERGTGGHIWASVTGKGSKEIAQMIRSLGLSLHFTQRVLLLVIRIQEIKNKSLINFHRALVEKITELKADTQVLDDDRRKMALAIAEKLRNQVRAQFDQFSMVEAHEKKIREQEEAIFQLKQNFELNRSTKKWFKRNFVSVFALLIGLISIALGFK